VGGDIEPSLFHPSSETPPVSPNALRLIKEPGHVYECDEDRRLGNGQMIGMGGEVEHSATYIQKAGLVTELLSYTNSTPSAP
jgi:hypothetical protein